ncbi:MAG: enoyl-CoA hydratase/isomerase family protein, partial [Solirubrobacterales bacterium]
MSAISYRDLVATGDRDDRELVSIERHADRAIVRLDDPDKLNVLSAPLMLQLREACEELGRDPDLRAIVLTG